MKYTKSLFNSKETFFFIGTTLLFTLHALNILNIWEIFIVPQNKTSFYDFKCVQQWGGLIDKAFLTSEYIYAKHTECILNHPRIWVFISNVLSLENNKILYSLIYVLIGIYILIFSFQIKKYNSFFLIYFFFSGASLLLLERANNDLIIFIILFSLTAVNNNFLSYLIYFFSSILKIYPIFGIFYFLNNIKEIKKILLVTFFLIIYFFLFRYDIYQAINNTPKTGNISYGSLAISLNILKHLNLNINYIILSLLFCVLTLLIYFIWFRKNFDDNLKHSNIFLLGAGIFLSTFLLSSHFDYRLVFLFFSIPLIVNLNNNNIKFITLILIIFSLEVHRLIYFFGFFGGLINNISKVLLFIILSLIFLKVLENKLIKKIN